MQRTSLRHALLNFDIDALLNPFLPAPPFARLPRPISHFLGHRSSPPTPLPATIETLHATASIFLALLAVTAIANFSPALTARFSLSPLLIPSLGAGAILNYVAIANPAAQPRPTILGQLLSAAVGVGVARLFGMLDDPVAFRALEWVATPLAVALAGLAMRLTGTVHPPGGATAALAVSSAEIQKLGWWLLPLVTVGTSTMVAAGLVLNNIGRRWPVFWWTSVELPVGKKKPATRMADEKADGGVGEVDEEATVGAAESGRGSKDGPRRDSDTEAGGSATFCHHCGRH